MKNQEEFIKQINKNLNIFCRLNSKYASTLKRRSIKKYKDFQELPFMERNDLQQIKLKEKKDYIRIHSTSGTTSKPIIIPYTKQDIDDWTTMMSRCYKMIGITKKDIIQIATGYGLWTAGIGFQLGCEKLGALAIPVGCDSTEKQLEYFKKMKSTVLCATSSYGLYLSEKVNKRDIYLKKGIFGSEIWGQKTKNKIEKKLNIKCYDIYGMTECYGPGIAINCDKSDYMHYWNDYFYFEIIDPDTKEVLEDGNWGELVITSLKKEGVPLIRYRTHDITRIIAKKCKCKSKYPQIDKIIGRTDDMFKFHGVKLFPKQFEIILNNYEMLSPKYELILKNENKKDLLYFRCELEDDKNENLISNLEIIMKEDIKKVLGINVEIIIEKNGTLLETSSKTKHLYDYRNEKNID